MNAKSVYESAGDTTLRVDWLTAGGTSGFFESVARVEFIPPQDPVAMAVFMPGSDDQYFECFFLPLANYTQLKVHAKVKLA